MNKVYTIVLNYNSWKDTVECVRSLLDSEDDMMIIVVDNGSTNGSSSHIVDYLRNGRPLKNTSSPIKISYGMVDVVELKQDTQVDMKTGQVGIVQSDKNGGFSAGNNIGIRIAMKDADCTHIWLLNNDTVVNKYTLRKSLDHFVHYSHLGILGSKLIMYEKPEYLQGYGASFNVLSGKSTILGFKSSSNIESPVLMSPDCVIGASMLVSRSYIEQVGYLDDRYFLYKEELDWALRGKSKSFKCMASMNTGIYHKQGVTTGNKLGGKRNLQSMYYMLQSHLIFYRKFYYYLLPVAYLVVLYRILKMSIKNGEEYLSLLKPYFRGFDV